MLDNTHTEMFLPSTATPLPWESPSLGSATPTWLHTANAQGTEKSPLVPPQEAGKLPTFSGDAECKWVGVRGADALTGMFCQEPALLSGDGARVVFAVSDSKKRDKNRLVQGLPQRVYCCHTGTSTQHCYLC